MFENFGEIIKKLRVEHNITQKDLARRLEVSLTTVSRWENGRGVIPATKTLIDICLLFGISLNDLAGIAKENTVPIDMLTSEQQELLKILVMEFKNTKRFPVLSERQNKIILMLFAEFTRRTGGKYV